MSITPEIAGSSYFHLSTWGVFSISFRPYSPQCEYMLCMWTTVKSFLTSFYLTGCLSSPIKHGQTKAFPTKEVPDLQQLQPVLTCLVGLAWRVRSDKTWRLWNRCIICKKHRFYYLKMIPMKIIYIFKTSQNPSKNQPPFGKKKNLFFKNIYTWYTQNQRISTANWNSSEFEFLRKIYTAVRQFTP